MNTATSITNFQVQVLTASDMLVNVYVCDVRSTHSVFTCQHPMQSLWKVLRVTLLLLKETPNLQQKFSVFFMYLFWTFSTLANWQ